jgi:hypothetical protein
MDLGLPRLKHYHVFDKVAFGMELEFVVLLLLLAKCPETYGIYGTSILNVGLHTILYEIYE